MKANIDHGMKLHTIVQHLQAISRMVENEARRHVNSVSSNPFITNIDLVNTEVYTPEAIAQFNELLQGMYGLVENAQKNLEGTSQPPQMFMNPRNFGPYPGFGQSGDRLVHPQASWMNQQHRSLNPMRQSPLKPVSHIDTMKKTISDVLSGLARDRSDEFSDILTSLGDICATGNEEVIGVRLMMFCRKGGETSESYSDGEQCYYYGELRIFAHMGLSRSFDATRDDFDQKEYLQALAPHRNLDGVYFEVLDSAINEVEMNHNTIFSIHTFGQVLGSFKAAIEKFEEVHKMDYSPMTEDLLAFFAEEKKDPKFTDMQYYVGPLVDGNGSVEKVRGIRVLVMKEPEDFKAENPLVFFTEIQFTENTKPQDAIPELSEAAAGELLKNYLYSEGESFDNVKFKKVLLMHRSMPIYINQTTPLDRDTCHYALATVMGTTIESIES